MNQRTKNFFSFIYDRKNIFIFLFFISAGIVLLLPLRAGAATDSYTPFDFSNIKTGFRVDQATGDIYNLSTGNKIGNAYSSAQLEDIKGAMVGQDGKLTQNFYDHRGLIAPAGSNVENNTGILFNPSDSPSNPNSLPIGSIFNPKAQRDYYSLDADSGAVTDTNLPIEVGKNPFNIIRDPSTRAQMFDSTGKLKKDVYLSGPTGTMVATAGSTLEADTEKMTYFVTDPSGKRTDLSSVLRGASERIANEPTIWDDIWTGLKNVGGGVMEMILAVLKFIPALLIVLVFLTLAILTSFLASLAALLVSWILSPGFMGVSYTDPANNPIIRIGLDLTQGLVNLALILVLVFIALATILRLAGYETKKLLPAFILVALLVNFSPVICGVVIDASNIAMNAFIPKIEGEGIVEFGKSLSARTEGVMTTLKSAGMSMISNLSDAPDRMGQLAGQLVALTFVYASMFVIYLLYALLFMARYVVIWVLVILSPLAFACYILPATKKYWEQWWNNFLQWAFIGAIGAFFINLAEQVAQNMNKIYGNEVPGSTTANVDFIEGIFFTGVPIIFLWIGFFFALQSSAMGAQAVISFGKKAGGWVGRKAGTKTWRTIEDKLRIREGVKRAISAVDKSAGKRFGAGKLVRWAMPDKLRKYSENSAAIAGLKGNFDKESSIALMDGLTSGRFSGVEAAAALNIMKDRGDGEDIMQAYMRKLGYDKNDPDVYNKLFQDKRFLQDNHLLRALDVLDGAGMKGKALRNEPRLARVGIVAGSKDPKDGHKLTSEEAAKKQKEAMEKTIRDSKPSDIATWEKEVLQDEELMEVFMGVKNEDAYRAAAGLKDGITRARRSFAKNFEKFKQNILAGVITDYAATQDGYFNYLADKNNIKRSELGYRKLLDNPRMKTAGWGNLADIILPAPGEAAMGVGERIAATPVPPRRPPEEGETSKTRSQFQTRRMPPDQGENTSKKSSKKEKRGGPPDQGEV